MTTNAQQEPDTAVQLRNGRVPPPSATTTQSPERTSSINCPVPSPRQSSQGNQEFRSLRLKAISTTPGSASLLDDGALVHERNNGGADDYRPAVDGGSSAGVRSSGSRPLGGNKFFSVAGLHSNEAAPVDETLVKGGECTMNVLLDGRSTGSVPVESRC